MAPLTTDAYYDDEVKLECLMSNLLEKEYENGWSVLPEEGNLWQEINNGKSK